MGIKKTAHYWGTAALAITLFAGLTACSTADAKPAITPDNGSPVATATKPAEPESVSGTLVEVLSGDTIVLSPVGEDAKPTGEPDFTVRILGISAPKIDECGGPEAVVEMTDILAKINYLKVTFEEGVKHVNAEGQTVGTILSGDGSGSPQPPAYRLVEGGYASAWLGDNPTFKGFKAFEQGATIAKDSGAGLWDKCDTVGLGS